MTNTRNGAIANIVFSIGLAGLAIFILYQLLRSFGVLEIVADIESTKRQAAIESYIKRVIGTVKMKKGG